MRAKRVSSVVPSSKSKNKIAAKMLKTRVNAEVNKDKKDKKGGK